MADRKFLVAKSDSTFVSVMKIFFNGIKLYFMNFEKFFKYMAFPIFGQIIGIALIFFASYIFTIHISSFTTKSPVFDNIPLVFLVLILLTLPGFFIFCKAFWDYLIAIAALNSMSSTVLEGGNLEDTGMHAELIKRRSGSYILLLLLLSVIYLILSVPILWGLLVIAFVYLSLSFQVFALEEEKGAFDAIKTGINLVKFNFIKTSLLLIMLGILTYWLLPGLICWGFEKGDLVGFFSYPAEQYIRLLPLNDLNSMLHSLHLPITIKSYDISKAVVLSCVSFIVTGFTLPMRSLCCTNLYKDIYKKNYAGKIAADKLASRAQTRTPKRKRNVEDEEE